MRMSGRGCNARLLGWCHGLRGVQTIGRPLVNTSRNPAQMRGLARTCKSVYKSSWTALNMLEFLNAGTLGFNHIVQSFHHKTKMGK
jgi:hypothetical protein